MKTPLNLKTFSTKLLLCLIFIASFIVIAHLVAQYLNLNVYSEQNGAIFELSNRLDLDDEISVGSWFSQFLFLFLAILSFLAAYLNKKNDAKILWCTIGAGALLLSVDEGAGLHEFVLQMIHNTLFLGKSPTALANAWWILLPFIIAVFSWLLYKMFKLFDKKTVFLFGLATFVLLIGAIGVDQITSIGDKSTFTNQGILVAIEESFEFLATILFIYATSNYIEERYKLKISKALKILNT